MRIARVARSRLGLGPGLCIWAMHLGSRSGLWVWVWALAPQGRYGQVAGEVAGEVGSMPAS